MRNANHSTRPRVRCTVSPTGSSSAFQNPKRQFRARMVPQEVEGGEPGCGDCDKGGDHRKEQDRAGEEESGPGEVRTIRLDPGSRHPLSGEAAPQVLGAERTRGGG